MHADGGCALQAEFFGLPGLADKASLGLDADSGRIQGEAAGPSPASPAGDVEFERVCLETGFHRVKSEFDVLQQQQASTMQVPVLSQTCWLAQSMCCPSLPHPTMSSLPGSRIRMASCDFTALYFLCGCKQSVCSHS